MNSKEKQSIHILFETENFLELYQTQAETIREMLSIDNQQDFEEFLESENFIDEDVFWLYYAVTHGESLLIGGYEEDVTGKITDFLKQQLPDSIFLMIQGYLQNLYVDIDGEDNLEEKISCCNQCLRDKNHLLQLDFDDTYCVGAYFLSVIS